MRKEVYYIANLNLDFIAIESCFLKRNVNFIARKILCLTFIFNENPFPINSNNYPSITVFHHFEMTADFLCIQYLYIYYLGIINGKMFQFQ